MTESHQADGIALSVVMPVYAGADPEHFRRALESVYAQTYPAAEVIVVEDGPLTEAHHRVLDGFADRSPTLRRVALANNQGVAVAVQNGIMAAAHDWIARADSDDVNLPERFARQAAAVSSGDLDCVGAAMQEFDTDESLITGVRRMPESREDIARYMRRNNPFNHPTLVLRRRTVVDVGGYRPLPYMEDYDLMARMLAAGARMRNLPEPLVAFRAGDAMLGRRRARGIFASERTMQRNLREYGLSGPVYSRVSLIARTTFRLLPAPLLRRAYDRLFLR